MLWDDLDPNTQLLKVIKADQDPLYFMKDQYFLDQKLWPEQVPVVEKFYGSNKRLFIWVAGQRSSKTYMLGNFGAYELFQILSKDYVEMFELAKDSPIFLTCCAAAEKQVEDTAFYHLRSRIINSPYLMSFKPRIVTDSITFRLKPNIIIRALATESATAAGRTNKAVLLDEVSNLRDTSGPAGLNNVFTVLRNSTETFRERGHMFVFGSLTLSTNMLKLYDDWETSPEALCMKSNTWDINPYLPRSHFAELEKRDLVSFLRSFGTEAFASTDVYYRNHDILRYGGPNKLLMLYEGLKPEVEQVTYALAGDPAINHESFGVVLAHSVGDEIVVDGLLRFQPEGKAEINPLELSDFLLKVIDTFPVGWAVFDIWAYAETQEKIRQAGIPVVNHIVRKPEHDKVKERYYNEKLTVPFYEPYDREVKGLVVKSKKVTHLRGRRDDISSALANVVWLLEKKKINRAPILVKVV